MHTIGQFGSVIDNFINIVVIVYIVIHTCSNYGTRPRGDKSGDRAEICITDNNYINSSYLDN